MTCHFCSIFRSGGLRTWFDGTGSAKQLKKMCPEINKAVSPSSVSCGNIVVNEFFFCTKCAQFISVRVCLKRHIEQVEECKNCKQGDALLSFMRGRPIGRPKTTHPNGLRKRA